MNHLNHKRLNGPRPDLATRVAAAFDGSENPSGPPTEGIRAITAIVGMAADAMSKLGVQGSAPVQLGHLAAGNNAATPPPSQRVSGLNAGELARLAAGSGLPAGRQNGGATNPSAYRKNANPDARRATPASTPKSAPTSTPAAAPRRRQVDSKPHASKPAPKAPAAAAPCDPSVASCKDAPMSLPPPTPTPSDPVPPASGAMMSLPPEPAAEVPNGTLET